MTIESRLGRGGEERRSRGRLPRKGSEGLPRKGSEGLPRKGSDAALYGFNRPREMEEMRPEREPLTFDEASIPEEMMPAMRPLLDLSRSQLWHWKTFPIILPSPITVQSDPSHTSTTSMSRKKTINIRDLFVEPNFHELEAVATDSKGEPRRLSQDQLESIRQTGRFQVDSEQFSGQQHSWQLCQLLQKGRQACRDSLHTDLAHSLRLLVVTGRDCLLGPSFSVREAVNGWSEGLVSVLDCLVGLSSMEPSSLELRLHEERAKYLVCELSCPLEGSIRDMVSFVRRMIVRARTEKGGAREEENTPLLTFIFQTPQGQELDLRLCSKEVMSRVKPVLMKLLEQESRGWFPDYRQRVLSELRARPLTGTDLELEANRRIGREFVRRVSSAVLGSSSLAGVGEGIPQLLDQQLRAGVISQESLQQSEQLLAEQQRQEEQELREHFPIRSRIPSWLARRLAEAKASFIVEHQWAAHEAAIRACREAGLLQQAYFLSRDLSFLQHQEPVLAAELRAGSQQPRFTFQFRTQIWRPSNWLITANYQGNVEVIPTVVFSGPTKNSSFIRHNSPAGDKPVYLLQKEVVVTTSSSRPGWRWTNFWHRTHSWTWNALFIFAVILPWCSAFSLRALFFPDAFFPDYEVSQTNGALHRKPGSRTPTMSSRLRALWLHISKSRTEFESGPDRGLLGKSVLRHFNRLSNYLVKGVLGTLAIVTLFPLACVLVSYCSLLVALVAPLLVPSCSLLLHLASALLYDWETGRVTAALLPALVWHVGIQGLLQPLLCLLGLLLCPLAAAALAAWAVTRAGVRQAWDSVMFQLVIRARARVPAGDSFVARRTGGPGMAGNYYYQIKTEQALVALEARMEMEELEAYKAQLSAVISSPLEVYRKFVANSLRPLSVSVTKSAGGPYCQLDREVTGLLNSLHEKVDARSAALKLQLPEPMRKRIKQSERELKLSLSRGAAMVASFYPSHVIGRSPHGATAWWEGQALRQGDWVGLVSRLYSGIFAPDFLTPMQEADTTFPLRAEHWNLTRYLNMVLETDWQDDIDVARAVHAPHGNIHLQSPYLDPSLFNPLATTGTHLAPLPGSHTNRRWLVVHRPPPPPLPRLCVPLPVPHPAEVSIIIHNRESSQEISMEQCRPIIRELREFPQPASAEYLSTRREEDRESRCSGSLASHCSRVESVYEMGEGREGSSHSLAQSLQHLDTAASRPCLLQVSRGCSQATLEFPSPRSPSSPLATRPPSSPLATRSYSSPLATRSPSSPLAIPLARQQSREAASRSPLARIASAEDVRLEEHSATFSTVV